MKKAEALAFIESKGDADFIVRTDAEDKTFLENYGKKIEEEQIPAKISELHNRYDEDIFSVTGLRKNPTEKTYEFAKRVLSEYKSKSEKADILTREIADLKRQIADGTGDKKTLADLKAMQEQYAALEASKNQEVDKIKGEFENYKIQNDLLSAASGLKFKKTIPEVAIKALLNQAITELTQNASRQDGKLVFLKDGAPMRNPHNALNPYTAEELLKEKLKDVIDTGKKPAEGGPDINKEIQKEYDKNGKLTKVSLMIPDSVRTKEDLSDYLVKAGLLRGTQEYIKAYAEYSINLPFA